MWRHQKTNNSMKIEITAQQALKVLYVLSWIIFIGVCIDAGIFITNALARLFLAPEVTARMWQAADLSSLYRFDRGHFFVVYIFICIVAVMRAILFYRIVKILYEKKLDMARPFNTATGGFITLVAYLSLGIGLFALWGSNYTAWLVTQGVRMPDIGTLLMGGADVWLFMGITLMVIAQIFKRGIEIQAENELTV